MKTKRFTRLLFLYIPLGYISLSLLLVLLLKWAPVPATPLMLVRSIQNIGNESYHTRKKWIPAGEISRVMTRAVIASEDQSFYNHGGFDLEEISRMRADHLKKGKPMRGCSTISQQTAKNCFTFCTRTWVRKGIEAYYTVLIEKIWGKERIMEVYLNIAEMGVGIFGVEAASEKYFSHKASALSEREAASLACCLPNPLKRTPRWVEKYMNRRCSDVVNLMHLQ